MKRFTALFLRLVFLIAAVAIVSDAVTVEAFAARSSAGKSRSKKVKKAGKSVSSKSKATDRQSKKGRKKSSKKERTRKASPKGKGRRAQIHLSGIDHKNTAVITVRNLINNPDSETWVRKGIDDIIIAKDSTGTVRAMQPFIFRKEGAMKYAEALNDLAKNLDDTGIRIYTLLIPTQSEFYMPEKFRRKGMQKHASLQVHNALNSRIRPVSIIDTLSSHSTEPIYSRSDIHWTPLGARYGAKVFAEGAGVPFLSLDEYRTDTVHGFTGSMYKYSGDAELKKYPEDFVFYIPPEGYRTEYISFYLDEDSILCKNVDSGTFFAEIPDGSPLAYQTFMGGDRPLVVVSETGAPVGRRLLVVKDSHANAALPFLFGSFEQIHILDYRLLLLDIADYVRENGITDLLFAVGIPDGLTEESASRLSSFTSAKQPLP